MAARKKRSVGAPTKFKQEFCERATRLCLLGLTNDQLAASFEVTTSTLGLWMKKNAQFSDAVKAGREDADGRVAHSLFSRANGFSHPEEVVQYDTKLGKWTRTQTVKKYAPDPTSMIFWSKNRRPDLWRDTPKPEDTDETPAPVSISIDFKDARRQPKE